MKNYIIACLMTVLALPLFAQSAKTLSLSKDYKIASASKIIPGTYTLDVNAADFSKTDMKQAFDKVSTQYARFTADPSTGKVSLTVDVSQYPKVAAWTQADWDNHMKIVSSRLRHLSGNVPQRTRPKGKN
jgi:PKD repeat protein